MNWDKIYKKEKVFDIRKITVFNTITFSFNRKNLVFTNNRIALSAKVKNAKLMGFNAVGKNAVIEAKKGSIIINKGTNIGKNTRIIVQNDANIKIGENCNIGQNCYLVTNADIELGNNVLMASNIRIITGNHCYEDINTPITIQPCKYKKVILNDECWIGDNVLILSGVTIGKHSVIGGGSVVTKSIPDYCVAVGNPCRIIKKYNLETKTWEKVSK